MASPDISLPQNPEVPEVLPGAFINKRKRDDQGEQDEEKDTSTPGMGQALAPLRPTDLPEFNLTSQRSASQDYGRPQSKSGNCTASQEPVRKKAKKLPKPSSGNYPEIKCAMEQSRLNSAIKISDLQNLVLYILADGTAPQFVSVRHRNQIRKVVVLMVPGIERQMFDPKYDATKKDYSSPDQYYPKELKEENLSPELQAFAEMFDHMWPCKTPGDDKMSKMHSPLQAMLTAQMPKSREDKRSGGKHGKGPSAAKEVEGWKNTRTRVAEFLLTPEELLENEYVGHPAMCSNEDEKKILMEQRQLAGLSKDHGWVDTSVKAYSDGDVPEASIESGSLTAGREILAMDCEMCMTGENEFSLTRISIVSWDGSVLLDELVVPDKPIIDYVTQYSGITKEMLASVTTSLADIQQKLLQMITSHTILLGHSLNSDMTALKMTHPFIIDTAILYPHPRGPPLKSSLKWLAQKYLNKEIQKGHGETGPGAGHNSIEDAKTCLDLLKQKCEKGKHWGTGAATAESIFKRISRTGIKYKSQGGFAVATPMDARSSAAIDWGDIKKGPGSAATFGIGCKNDEDVVKGVIRAVKGDPDGLEISGGGVDFVWARMRELEALKGWWNKNRVVIPTAAASVIQPVAVEAVIVTEASVASSGPPVDDIALAAFIKQQGAGGDLSNAKKQTPTVEANTTHPKALPPPQSPDSKSSAALSAATGALSARIAEIHASLPPCTALIVYSGNGDPREMSRMNAMRQQFRREYKVKKWDQLSVKWTDDEEQELKRATAAARNGIAFMTVK
ncbi:hypothetical protein BJ878DRAFT_500993 [Calycina marina]|uniref:Exonuclease domain-containing protein n=1 Tax=Calycina marina TaxID=1763456 RepID=A0A9P8CFU9_9HELO|nr:hypothetical protein BJ878DRAFT_500993 [Calycina marina]